MHYNSKSLPFRLVLVYCVKAMKQYYTSSARFGALAPGVCAPAPAPAAPASMDMRAEESMGVHRPLGGRVQQSGAACRQACGGGMRGPWGATVALVLADAPPHVRGARVTCGGYNHNNQPIVRQARPVRASRILLENLV